MLFNLSLELKKHYNYAKLSLPTVYSLVHSFDVICYSETYLNSETPPNNTRLELQGYNLFLYDYPSNNKRVGVCIYYKSSFKNFEYFKSR